MILAAVAFAAAALASGSARAAEGMPLATVSVRDFGADPDCGTSSSAPAFQKAADHVASVGGGTVSIPKGFYCFGPTDEVVVRGPVQFVGEGRGANVGTGYYGGTLVRLSNPTAVAFRVESRGAVAFRNFAIDSSIPQTSGGAISLAGDRTVEYNFNSEISGMFFGQNLHDPITIRSAQNFTISGNVIKDWRHYAIFLVGDGAPNPDATAGQAHVIGNSIHAFSTYGTAMAGIRYECGGDVEIVGNKIIGGHVGLHISMHRGPTGSVIVSGNSLEQHRRNSILVERVDRVASFANLVINGNQFSTIEDGAGWFDKDFQGSIRTVDDGGPAWLWNVSVVGNVFNMGVTKPVANVDVQAGHGVIVAHNISTNIGRGGMWAFGTGGRASRVLFDQNLVRDMPGGAYNTVTGSTTVVRDVVNGLPVAALGAWANGSEVYVADGKYGSAPLAAGGYGTFARRIADQWRG